MAPATVGTAPAPVLTPRNPALAPATPALVPATSALAAGTPATATPGLAPAPPALATATLALATPVSAPRTSSVGHPSGSPAPAGPGGQAPVEERADGRGGLRWAGAGRRGAGDPVKALLHRHRELCERAVEPGEIAAGLEAHGVTDRTAARCRHRDVFSLAEELYARVPRDAAEPCPRPRTRQSSRVRAGRLLLVLLPGALGAATVAGLRLTAPTARASAVLGGLLALGLATRAVLRHGPLAGASGTRARRTAARVGTLWLLGYALAGDGLLHAVLTGGPDALPTGVTAVTGAIGATGAPDGAWPLATAPVLALLLACAPAACSAHLLTAGARRALADSRGLKEFTALTTPLLLGALTLFLGALAALLALCGAALHQPAAPAQALTLGALLLLARLLTVHRHRRAPAFALGAAAVVEAAALVLPAAARLPGCAFLAVPVEGLVDAWGEAAVPALACGTAALALLWQAGRTLTRASAHAPAAVPE
ncbi:hypothetical protein [Streptomyces sp. NPDC017086]|uniref:hypothetical protein n=1 Tax=unclassified Streptomyces TaxID=2593676 RepID=UPI0037B54697